MPKPGCKVLQKALQAEMKLREALNESEHEMALMDAASLGNVITSLVRWQNKHYAACAYLCGCGGSGGGSVRPRKRVLLIDDLEDERGITRLALEVRGFRVVSEGPAAATLRYDSEHCTVVGNGVHEAWPVEYADMSRVVEAVRRACVCKPGPKPVYERRIA